MEATPPEAVRLELRRLASGYARAVGGARAGRWHLVLLLGACALAFLHRTVRPLPWLDAVQDSWPLLLGIAAGLYAVGPLLRFGFALATRPGVTRLARDLDDRYGWHDQTDTALHAAADQGGLGALLAVQAGGRLREVDASALARAGRPLGRIRLILALLFVALLVLPGVGGSFGARSHAGGLLVPGLRREPHPRRAPAGRGEGCRGARRGRGGSQGRAAEWQVMRRLPRLAVALLAAGLVGLGAARVHGEEEPAKADGIAWFSSLAEARAVAAKTGRPLFVAMHVRPRVASPAAKSQRRSTSSIM
ncbi:MAG: hypothetical protein P1V36_16960, partial [Planctomycetota bacterium]|nr:hypothetical protein [Planctomycetota bacterium]